uniref:Putative chaperone protein DNAj n=1 Tax=Trypanosoma congolense (strain IL3000) TaxID=1068625 RepID=G0US41_TRYCI|nr:putative chaperone protein DNAj [Trypanosoma congolense IL3000]
MFGSSRWWCCMSVGRACQIMDFTAPPVDRAVLKRRYVELVKKCHPDNNGPESSAEAMINLTKACKTLQRLLDNQNTGMPHNISRNHAADLSSNGRTHREEVEEVAASFVAPGTPLSMAGWDLPWQRCRTTTQAQRLEKEDQKLCNGAGSLMEYVTLARAQDRRRKSHAESVASHLKSSEGSHGFNSQHFEQMFGIFGYDQRVAFRRRSLMRLVCSYYHKRLLRAWSRGKSALRYIVTGI